MIVALLTGKGNNTLKDKNLIPILGRPLLYYPAIAAKKSSFFTHFYVSSDGKEILNVANNIGYKKIKEPIIDSNSNHRHIDSILFALEEMKKDNVFPDILVILLANSVSVKKKWIEDCIQQILDNDKISAVVPVVKHLDKHPYRAKKINRQNFLEPFFDFKNVDISTNRQDLEPNYFLCHNFWVLNTKKSIYSKKGQPPWTFMGNKIRPYIVEESIDVHDRDDIVSSTRWLKKYGDKR